MQAAEGFAGSSSQSGSDGMSASSCSPTSQIFPSTTSAAQGLSFASPGRSAIIGGPPKGDRPNVHACAENVVGPTPPTATSELPKAPMKAATIFVGAGDFTTS